MAAYNIIQKGTLITLLVVAGAVAKVTGQFDSLKETIGGLYDSAKSLLPKDFAKSALAELKKVGVDLSALEKQLAGPLAGNFNRALDLGDTGSTKSNKSTKASVTGIPDIGEKSAAQRVLEDLRFETDQLGLNSTQIEINNALRAAGVIATSKQGEAGKMIYVGIGGLMLLQGLPLIKSILETLVAK